MLKSITLMKDMISNEYLPIHTDISHIIKQITSNQLENFTQKIYQHISQ